MSYAGNALPLVPMERLAGWLAGLLDRRMLTHSGDFAPWGTWGMRGNQRTWRNSPIISQNRCDMSRGRLETRSSDAPGKCFTTELTGCPCRDRQESTPELN